MDERLLNTWHCDECEYVFYVDLGVEKLPSYCPNCQSHRLSDSKILEVKPFNIKNK